MKSKYWAAIGIVFLILASCAPSAKKIPAPVITPPARTAAVTPAAKATHDAITASSVASARLEGQVIGLKNTTVSLQESMDKTLAEITRLKLTKTATEKELIILQGMAEESEVKVSSLLAEVELAKTTSQEQSKLRLDSERRVEEMLNIAAIKDVEVTTLRMQASDLNNIVAKQAEEMNVINAKLSKAEKGAAVGSYFKGVIWFLAIAGVAFIAFKIFLASTVPKII